MISGRSRYRRLVDCSMTVPLLTAAICTMVVLIGAAALALIGRSALAGAKSRIQLSASRSKAFSLVSDTDTPASTPLTSTPISTPTFTSTPSRTVVCELAWSTVPSANGGGTDAINLLEAVAAISQDDAWAVGYWVEGSPVRSYPLVEHWDGVQWDLVDVSIPQQDVKLYGISVVSAGDIWAVGTHKSFDTPQTLTIHWDGTQWSTVGSPNLNSELNWLSAVAVISTNHVWAVGYYRDPQTQNLQRLTEHWDGAQWSIVSSPNNPEPYGSSTLYGVAAVSSNDVWAVGSDPPSNQHAFIHWDGIQWSEVTAPGYDLYGVSALATNDVWAVGTTGWNTTLIEHWNGTRWTVIDSPNPGTYTNYLKSVAAISSNDVWAVGNYGNGTVEQPLIVHWDGAQWSVAEGAQSGYSSGIATVSDSYAWSVGQYFDPSADTNRTLVQRLSNPCGTGTPTVTPTVTATPTLTSTPCSITFTDVQTSDYFYNAVVYLYCRGVISGYSDNTFRPYANTTRGQLSKIIVLAEGWVINTRGGPTFSDVPESNVFYPYVETAHNAGVISGYSDGTFKPGNDVTRGQLSKIIVIAQRWLIDTYGGPHFTDVETDSTFYGYVETAYNHGIISGYADGTFKPGNSATRGQISKIVYNAVTGQ